MPPALPAEKNFVDTPEQFEMRIRFQIWGVGGGRLRQFRKGAPNRNLLLFFNARVASHLGSLICAPSASRGHAVERAASGQQRQGHLGSAVSVSVPLAWLGNLAHLY